MSETIEKIKQKQLNGDYKYHIWVDTSESGFADHKAKFDTVVDAEDEINSLITTIESQKEEIESLNNIHKGYAHQSKVIENGLKSQIESLKAITELAVKGLKEIACLNVDSAYSAGTFARNTLSEIARLQNE